MFPDPPPTPPTGPTVIAPGLPNGVTVKTSDGGTDREKLASRASAFAATPLGQDVARAVVTRLLGRLVVMLMEEFKVTQTTAVQLLLDAAIASAVKVPSPE